MKYINRLTTLFCVIVTLSACSSGSSDSENIVSDSVKTGKFSDLKITGLHYQTATQTGQTNSKGEFKYIQNEMITFSLGDIEILTTQSADELSLSKLFVNTLPDNSHDLLAAVNINNKLASDFDYNINLATLLFALDQDGDINNGLDFGNLNDLLTNTDLNLNVNLRLFLEEQSIINFLGEYGNTIPESPIDVIIMLYEKAGVLISSEQIDRVMTITNNTYSSIEYIYTDEMISEKLDDFNNDNAVDRHSIYTWNQADRLVTSDIISGNNISSTRHSYSDNKIQSIEQFLNDVSMNDETYNYDLLGRIIKISNSVTGTTEYEYDSGSTRITEIITSPISEDIIKSEIRTYTNKKLLEWIKKDNNADGIYDERIKFTYDSDMRLIQEEFDYEGTTTFDEQNTYVYNDQGLLTNKLIDTNYDGYNDVRYDYEYDVKGRQTSLMIHLNLQEDEIADEILNTEYDTYGNIIHETFDITGQGKIYRDVSVSFNEYGELLNKTITFYNPDGTIYSQDLLERNYMTTLLTDGLKNLLDPAYKRLP